MVDERGGAVAGQVIGLAQEDLGLAGVEAPGGQGVGEVGVGVDAEGGVQAVSRRRPAAGAEIASRQAISASAWRMACEAGTAGSAATRSTNATDSRDRAASAWALTRSQPAMASRRTASLAAPTSTASSVATSPASGAIPARAAA